MCIFKLLNVVKIFQRHTQSAQLLQNFSARDIGIIHVSLLSTIKLKTDIGMDMAACSASNSFPLTEPCLDYSLYRLIMLSAF